MLELFEATVKIQINLFAKTLVVVSSVLLGFSLFTSNVQAGCGFIRDVGGQFFCDVNTNGAIDLDEMVYTACAGNPNACCQAPSECTAASTSDCNPGSGFISLGDCLYLSTDTKVSETYTTPAFLVNLLVRNLFVVAGTLLFFMILLAGFKFIVGGKKGLDDAKQIMTAALIGFLLMFSAYWIVQIIKLITRTNIVL